VSGPKGYGWQVDAAEVERQSVRDNARARCAAVREEALAAVGEIRAMGADAPAVADVPRIADSVSTEAARRAVERYEATLARIEEVRADARRALTVRVIDASVGEALAPKIAAWAVKMSDEAPAWTSVDAAPPPARAADRLAELLAAVAGAIAQVRDPVERERLLAEVRRTGLRGDAEAAAVRARELRQSAEAAVRDQRRTENVRVEAREIALSIAHVDSTAGREVRSALQDVDSRFELMALAAAARRAREQWDAHIARRHVIAQTAAVLAEMGHVIDGEFAVSAGAGRFAVAQRGPGDSYGMQVLFAEDTDTMLVNAVALTEDTRVSDDVAAEERMCADLDDVVQRLDASGVSLRRTHARRPGEVPVERATRGAVTRGAAAIGRAGVSDAEQAVPSAQRKAMS
jgi:DNA-directed RNA polymerase subunit K/omega